MVKHFTPNTSQAQVSNALPGFVSQSLIGGVGGEVRVVAPPIILWRVGTIRLDL